MQNLITHIDKNEVLRYLGHKGHKIPQKLDRQIDQCINRTIKLISPKYFYQKFSIKRTAEGILVNGTELVLTGRDIAKLLQNSNEIYIICATIGLEIEKEIRKRMLTNPDEGVMFDSCATTAIEQLTDRAECEIARECEERDLFITWRYSPGYGDLPIETQGPLLAAMDAHRKIGLTVNDSFLMTPGKSVTAIIGVTDGKPFDNKPTENKCDSCPNQETCEYRKRGETC